jgi:hypothetical protein
VEQLDFHCLELERLDLVMATTIPKDINNDLSNERNINKEKVKPTEL